MSRISARRLVVDNRPGRKYGHRRAIGGRRRAPDGYTLLMAIDSTLVMNQYLYTSLPYDPINDFAPISLVAKNMGLLVVNAESDLKTAKDLIAKAKARARQAQLRRRTITTKLTCICSTKKPASKPC